MIAICRKRPDKLKCKSLPILFVILFPFLSNAQKAGNDLTMENKLIKPYERYFQQGHEWVYTHLNKSAYILGDDIWFTCYVLNTSSRQLNVATSKLYAELWSPEKKLISRKILFVKDGSSSLYIHLPDSLAPGSYCFRAYTNWMRNFYSDKDFSTFITVLGQNKEIQRSTNSKENQVEQNPGQAQVKSSDWDIQMLPESGTFLEGGDNIIAVKVTDSSGRGAKINGKVLTGDNNEIAVFSTNQNGMGSFMIRETTRQKYILKAELPDSTKREVELPKIDSKGVVIQVNPFRADVISFRLQTNNATSQIPQFFTVMLHSNGVIFKDYRFQFPKTNSIQFKINKEELGNGIIYATVFDQGLTPVAERIFYNQNPGFKGKLAFKAETLTNDTVKMNINVVDSLNKTEFSKLSISVLPKETALSQFDNSLLAESVFRPALKGDIENPNSYFEKNDFGHNAAIDLLLLTQGWRKYDWPEMLQSKTAEFKFPFETAFSVEGKVKNWIKNKTDSKSKVSLFSPLNNLFLTVPVDSTGNFKFEKIYLADSTWVVVSATSSKGKNWNRAIQSAIPEYSMDVPAISPKLNRLDKADEVSDEIPNMIKGSIKLPEVVITGKKSDPFKNNFYVGATDKIVEVTKDIYREYENIEKLLLLKFNVRTEFSEDSNGNSGYYFNVGRGNLSISSTQKDLQPLMMVDGIKVYDAQSILDLPLDYIEAVSVNKDGFGAGFDGVGGIISISLRKTPFFVNDAEATNIKRIMVNGYAAPRKYFTPKYTIVPNTQEYKKYATIHWEPELITDQNNNASFKFYVPKEIKSLNVRAEGISVNGKVFLHEQAIDLPGKN
jgi:hypothetical protein